MAASVADFCTHSAVRLGAEFAARLDRLEAATRAADLGEVDLTALIGRATAADNPPARPVMLEPGVRLFDPTADRPCRVAAA